MDECGDFGRAPSQTTLTAHSILISVQVEIIRKCGCLLKSAQGDEYTKTAENEVEPIDKEVVAMLVYKKGQEGCVRVIGPMVKNIITGQGDNGQILLVLIGEGEKGWIYGQPRVRFYRRSNGHD